MKALFSRLKSASSSARDQFGGREKEHLPPPIQQLQAPPRSSSSPTPPSKGLPEWPPNDRTSSATPVLAKPLPDIQLPPAIDLPVPDSLSSASSAGVKRTAASALDASTQQKKVAFISPPGTPSPAHPKLLLDTTSAAASAGQPKTGSVAKLVAAHDSRNTPTASTTSVPARAPSTTPKPVVPRTASTPTSYAPSINQQSLRSGTPFSQTSSRTGILTTASWSEAAEEDLVSNLGPRERTRQEVLWEIVASEERYVNELLKLRETFIEPLLHPYSSSSVLNPIEDGDYYREDSPAESLEHLPIASRFLSTLSQPRSESPRLASPLARAGNGTPVIPSVDESAESEEDSPRTRKAAASKAVHPRSPYGTAARNVFKGGKPILPFPSRSHHSLPPPARNATASTASLGRQSFAPDQRPGSSEQDRKAMVTPTQRAVLRKPKKGEEDETGIPPHLLPEDLRRCLEVIEGGIINGHLTLSAGLRKRYDDQYPLVRSLADVFVAHSQILHEYATYVLHLERALEQVDNALSTASVMKRPKKADVAEWLKISKILQRLEENAADKGETGLAISLSKPFQRLLKYPLLFQNLLFHTDPSTYEYEATLRMVAEVETIVRSIEDEKIQKEERDKTRDIIARIEGLEKVKMLAVPKPSRLLVEERVLDPNSPDPSRSTSPPTASSGAMSPNGRTVKQKTSFRRISEVLGTNPSSSSPQIGSKKDLWLVVFNDVVLRCQRTGTTTLPLASSGAPGRANSLPESKSKYASASRRHGALKPRNLYKFVKVENWTIAKPREGIVSMEDIERSRGQTTAEDGEDDDEAIESDDSDRKSKMSFSYWGADRVTIQKPIVKGRTTPTNAGPRRITPTTPRAASRLGTVTPTNAPSSFATRVSDAAVRESKKDNLREQKFGTRLRSPEPSMDGSVSARPASRRTGAASGPGQRRHATNNTTMSTSTMDESVRSTTGPVASGGLAGVGAGGGRPAWDGSKSPAPPKRVRNLSQTSGTPPVRTGAKVSSPAPSEDSGVGLYRQMLSQDSGLAKSSK